MGLTSFLMFASSAMAPESAFNSQLSSGRALLKRECKTFDQAVETIKFASVAEGVRCLHVAAGREDPLALRALGLMRLRGEYLPKDEQEAVALFHRAARLGDAESMFLLGESFERGIGVAEDWQLARFWLERAAAQGYVGPQVDAR